MQRVALFSLALIGLLSTSSWALEPQTNNLVENVALNVPASFRVDGRTAYVGVRECETMIANNAIVSARFETTINPQEEDLEGNRRFDRAVYFEVERGTSPAINCDAGDQCVAITEDNLTFSSDSVQPEVQLRRLTGLGTASDCNGFDREYFLRVYLRPQPGSQTSSPADARIIVDTIRPAPPESITALATEGTIRVEFTPSPSNDVRRYIVYYSTSEIQAGADPRGENFNATSIFFTSQGNAGEVSVSLDEGEVIYVGLAAEDQAGNASLVSNVVEVEVAETIDFWEEYIRRGGAEEGGCQTAAGPGSLLPVALLLLLGGLLAIRRRISLAATLLVCFFALPVSDAMAQSPIYGNASFKIGGYYPNIDAEFDGSGPFEEIFGDAWLWYTELEINGYLYQGIGKAGFGLHFGYSGVTGTALSDVEGVSDDTKFRVYPLRASLLYRYDYSVLRHGIPLVPLARLGLDYHIWNVVGTDGSTATEGGRRALGGKFGWHAAFGLQFLLDILDPSNAAAFDLNWGVNNTFLFAEYVIARTDGFGADGFDLSDNSWRFGLTFEF